ncbi:insecticidal delta-endotoxin Cry8Ea1 family protein [Bacillus paranthracis]|uniref:Crystaline entomocidal protoxin n=1 Tax=Bacillus paranthracis TaxID=2026186 RepID=A0AAJ1K721_9BACI|nr:insecticidal delta-endotoxin Cry8Ea1 family protein [Bacillus paranthracis]MDG0949871.1 insecticidal delta-endotoxin Cry8Ea1 family protein [Bacillus paranthracis]MDG0955706.1 insecticidal delta-endotoxin Cry8Ea1 family protein [Bacillus paranthracis]
MMGLFVRKGKYDPWVALMQAVEALINQKISEFVKANALADLSALQIGFEDYTRALESWLENQDDRQRQSLVRTRFEDLYSAISRSMANFSVTGYETLLLPIYAQAATLHLLMAQDTERYGLQWGMSQKEDIDFYYKEQRGKREDDNIRRSLYKMVRGRIRILQKIICEGLATV